MATAIDQLGPTVARAQDALRAGNALLCFDVVAHARARGLDAPELEYLAILALAHCGSTQQALDRYHRTERSDADQDWLALEGRLFKDLAQQDSTATQFMYGRAAQSYWQAFQKTGGYFSAVNAATMFMLAGQTERALPIATDVLALTENASANDELERYNLLVSHAEAALLLGELDRCRKALRAADALARDHRTARARTVRQLRLICKARRVDKNLPGLLRIPPQVCVFRSEEIDVGEPGPLLSSSGDQLPPPPFDARGAQVYVAVLAPVDLCIATYFAARGARIFAVVPGHRDALMARWQERHGAGWAMRLARALEQAQEVIATPGYLDSEPLWMRQGVMARALGLSRLSPEPIRTDWIGLSAQPAPTPAAFALTELTATRSREFERSLLEVQCPLSEEPRTAGVRERRLCAVLAVEFRGVAALDESSLPRYWSQLLGALAPTLASSGGKLLERKTWGSALRLICADAVTAAEIALALRRQLTQIDDDESGLRKIELQLLLHFGPAFIGDDPIEGRSTCYGSELQRAQVLAGRAPPAAALGTEAFAARLVAESRDAYRIAYVGELPGADRAEQLRLFSVQRA